MKALLQRVSQAHAEWVDSDPPGETIAEIAGGLVVLLCADRSDEGPEGDGNGDTGGEAAGRQAAEFLARKIANMRIFEDDAGKMNLSLLNTGGQALVISQFTLAADWRKGNRPGFSGGAGFEAAERLWHYFCDCLEGEGVAVARGRFRSHLRIHLVNDGPVTIWMDTDDR